jgi:hypothetical protein
MKWKEYDGITKRTIRLEAAAIFWDFVEHCIFPEAYFMRGVLVNWQSRTTGDNFTLTEAFMDVVRKSGVRYLPIPEKHAAAMHRYLEAVRPEKVFKYLPVLRGTLTRCRNTSTT